MSLKVNPPWDEDDEVRHPVSAKSRRLADMLFAEIIAGEHDFGTRLPAERVLAKNSGVSRNTVRQALSLMEHFGIIQRRMGSGSVVCYRFNEMPSDAVAPSPALPEGLDLYDLYNVSETTSPLGLGVVRSILEPEIARLAVLNMTSRDIEAIKAIQLEIEAVSVDGDRFSTLDDAFRMQLVAGTLNPLLVAIYSMVNRVGREAVWSVQRRRRLSPARIKEYKFQNRSLCEALENRDIEAAVEYMKLSLVDFHQDLMRGT